MLMNLYIEPDRSRWVELTRRPTMLSADLSKDVELIMARVAEQGDDAVRDFTARFDKVSIQDLKLSDEMLKDGATVVNELLRRSIDQAYQNIFNFHQTQKLTTTTIETMPGVKCWREARPIDPIGLYIPGGTAPLFSTVLMLGVPAKIAGCHRIILCTPPNQDGSIAPEIIYAAKLCGIEQVFLVGGAQAIAALTFGTESIPAVAKIFGPGNQYVTEAKMQALRHGVAIDMPAGPSEVLVIADATANPGFLAADLLSQAEHGKDSQAVLLSTSQEVIEKTQEELERQLDFLPRKELARSSLRNSFAIHFKDLSDCFDFSNQYAPEHLILNVENWESYTTKIASAGSVFLGPYSPEAVGDYASGTNHTLPTNGWARSFSGVSVDSFVKKITFQNLSSEGLENIGDVVEQMAEAESLRAHKNAVAIRRIKGRTK